MNRTIRNPLKLLNKLAASAPPVLARYYTPDCCIAATWVALDVLGRFGLSGSPVVTRARVLNPAYRARAESGRECRDAEALARAWDEDGSWTVGVGFGAPTRDTGRPGLDGHLVAYLPVPRMPSRGVIIDLSLSQASRPERGIVLGPALLAAGADFWAGNYQYVVVNGCAVGYRIKTGPQVPDFRVSPDWRNAGGRNDRAAEELYRACR